MLKKISTTLCFIISMLTQCTAFAVTVQDLRIEDLQHLMNKKKKITVSILFTSWCSACKETLPKAMNLSAQYKNNDNIQFILISLDDDVESLNRFAKGYEKYDNELYYFDKKINKAEISRVFKKNGIQYNGTIPHMTIFFDSKAVANDNYEMNSVKNFIDYLSAKKM